jgi:diguanylate cyclase (GGDEF)-like protein
MFKHRKTIDELRHREKFVLEAMRDMIEASRISSTEVIRRLVDVIRTREPRLDTIMVFEPQGEELVCVCADGSRAQYFERLRLRRDAREFLPSRAAIDGHRAVGADGVVVPTDRRALAVPMRDRVGLRAVIYASSGLAEPLEGEEAVISAIEYAGSAYGLALDWEATRSDATYDGLTGLLTPRAFRERLRDEVSRLRLRPSPMLTLWFIDTDHFKNVNDTYGHAAGDAVLQGMARLMRAHTVTDVDAVGRNGGDEFCAIIHDAQKTIAIERAQEFCDSVRMNDFGIPLQITASVGVASFPYDAADANELLEVADAAMYHSKRNGRDRVSFAVNGTQFSTYRAPSGLQTAELSVG